jgi:hypothetical protein
MGIAGAQGEHPANRHSDDIGLPLVDKFVLAQTVPAPITARSAERHTMTARLAASP